MYQAVTAAFATEMSGFGFEARGKTEFLRAGEGHVQRLVISLREPPGEDIGYIEVFPGFNYPEIESLAANLQGKEPRHGFITCSLNIGLLTPRGTNLEWPLLPQGDAESITHTMGKAIGDFAVPFWDEFSSMDKLLAQFEAGDFRVCRGAEWPWRQAAAYCLMGRPERATEFLLERLSQASTAARPVIESALAKVAHYHPR